MGEMKQTDTWTWHAVICGVVPFAVGLLWHLVGFPGPLIAAAFLGIVLGSYYTFVREPANKRGHKAGGSWHTPDAQGITPMVDGHGDTVGPATAIGIWTFAMILSLL